MERDNAEPTILPSGSVVRALAMPSGRLISSHTMRVPSLEGLVEFYSGILGMRTVQDDAQTCAFALGPDCAQLIFRVADVTAFESQPNDFYWKIGLTVRDLDAAVEHLRSQGLDVPTARQFRDIGYMTKISDPSGFPIELLQQGFAGNPLPLGGGHPIGTQATFAHITLRVTDLAPSTQFFGEALGMRLMSIQPVPEYGFCLYFYAWSDEMLPDSDLEAVANREWLWQRPYTLIELQHLLSPDAAVRKVGPSTAGFEGFGYGIPGAGPQTHVSMKDLAALT